LGDAASVARMERSVIRERPRRLHRRPRFRFAASALHFYNWPMPPAAFHLRYDAPRLVTTGLDLVVRADNPRHRRGSMDCRVKPGNDGLEILMYAYEDWTKAQKLRWLLGWLSFVAI